MRPRTGSIGNGLLASLPCDETDELLAKLTRITLENRRPLYRAEHPIDFVYFVESGMISVVNTLENGVQCEVGMIGREGMLGASALSGTTVSFFDALVQMPVVALRMTVRDFRNRVETCAPLRNALLRYSEPLHMQAIQTAVCNKHHGVEQRLARWLLMAHDRMNGAELPLTQDFLAMMLGIYRPNVSVVAGNLQNSGLISYRSGRINVLDRPGPEMVACECYRVNHRRCEAVLSRSSHG